MPSVSGDINELWKSKYWPRSGNRVFNCSLMELDLNEKKSKTGKDQAPWQGSGKEGDVRHQEDACWDAQCHVKDTFSRKKFHV